MSIKLLKWRNINIQTY